MEISNSIGWLGGGVVGSEVVGRGWWLAGEVERN